MMQLQKYSRCGLLTTLLVAISAQPSIAFSIIPQQPGAIRSYEESVSDGVGKVKQSVVVVMSAVATLITSTVNV